MKRLRGSACAWQGCEQIGTNTEGSMALLMLVGTHVHFFACTRSAMPEGRHVGANITACACLDGHFDENTNVLLLLAQEYDTALPGVLTEPGSTP